MTRGQDRVFAVCWNSNIQYDCDWMAGTAARGDVRPGEEEDDEEDEDAEGDQVSAPAHHRVRCPPNYYTLTDPLPVRVQHKTHFENLGREVPWSGTAQNRTVCTDCGLTWFGSHPASYSQDN